MCLCFYLIKFQYHLEMGGADTILLDVSHSAILCLETGRYFKWGILSIGIADGMESGIRKCLDALEPEHIIIFLDYR